MLRVSFRKRCRTLKNKACLSLYFMLKNGSDKLVQLVISLWLPRKAIFRLYYLEKLRGYSQFLFGF